MEPRLRIKLLRALHQIKQARPDVWRMTWRAISGRPYHRYLHGGGAGQRDRGSAVDVHAAALGAGLATQREPRHVMPIGWFRYIAR